MTTRSLSLLFVLLAAACGGKADVLPDGGGSDSGGSDGGPPGPDCPATAPNLGDACSKNGMQCEYGSDIRSTCNTIATCIGGKFDYSFPADPQCPTPPVNPSECPATYADALSAGACSTYGTSCDYSTGSATRFCSCISFGGPILEDGGSQGTWSCSYPTQGCPADRPRIGATCSQPQLDCNYDSCGLPDGLTFECSASTGTWIVGPSEVCASAN